MPAVRNAVCVSACDKGVVKISASSKGILEFDVGQ